MPRTLRWGRGEVKTVPIRKKNFLLKFSFGKMAIKLERLGGKAVFFY